MPKVVFNIAYRHIFQPQTSNFVIVKGLNLGLGFYIESLANIFCTRVALIKIVHSCKVLLEV